MDNKTLLQIQKKTTVKYLYTLRSAAVDNIPKEPVYATITYLGEGRLAGIRYDPDNSQISRDKKLSFYGLRTNKINPGGSKSGDRTVSWNS